MKWFGRAKNSSGLAASLAEYPAYDVPHSSTHLTLSDAQALENFEYFQSHKQQRIASLHALLVRVGIDLKPALNGADYTTSVEALYQWAQNEWAPAINSELATRAVWRTTHRSAEHIIYSVVMDCAIALGEIVIARRPEYTWAVDLHPDNIKDQMPSARRTVLSAISTTHPEQPILIDWEAIAVAMVIKPQSAANRAINLWLRVCDEAVNREL